MMFVGNHLPTLGPSARSHLQAMSNKYQKNYLQINLNLLIIDTPIET